MNEKKFLSSHSIKITDIVIKFYGYITRTHCKINCLLYFNTIFIESSFNSHTSVSRDKGKEIKRQQPNEQRPNQQSNSYYIQIANLTKPNPARIKSGTQ